MDQFFETLTDDTMPLNTVSEAAFCRARQKLRPEALAILNDTLVDAANAQIAQRRWQAFRVLAVDGSTARLPNAPAIADYFGGPRGSGVPLARFSRLYDVLNDRVIQADMAPYRTGERELAAAYLLDSKTDDLFLYDRGYPAFWLFAFHHAEQRHYCARVRHDLHAEVTAFVADGVKQRTVTLMPNPTSARQCRDYHLPSDPLRVRLIRVELNNGEVEVLATSLLDEKAYPRRAFAKIYALRLGIEENYKREKQRLEIENFSGRSPWVVLQDFHAKIFVQNLTAIIATLAQWLADERYRHRQHTYRINFANALSKMKNNLVRLFLYTSPLDLCWRLLQRMADVVEAVRPGRAYPRNLKKVRVPGFQRQYRRTR
ncbi:MAG: IS4 family transposase [Sedimenticolaceae bacterium]